MSSESCGGLRRRAAQWEAQSGLPPSEGAKEGEAEEWRQGNRAGVKGERGGCRREHSHKDQPQGPATRTEGQDRGRPPAPVLRAFTWHQRTSESSQWPCRKGVTICFTEAETEAQRHFLEVHPVE